VVNFDALVRHGTIAAEDLQLFRYADDPAAALAILQHGIQAATEAHTPAIAHSKTSRG